MKVAFFSPLPPKRTGVADYSAALVAALRGELEVTCFDDNNPEWMAHDAASLDFHTHPEVLCDLGQWDVVVYSLGNNPHYHLGILRSLLRTRGVVLLHDTVLYFLFGGLPPGSFYRHFCETYGAERAGEIAQIRADSIDGNMLRYRFPERYPFLGAALKPATEIIVHSEFAANAVRAVAPGKPVHVIPHLALAPPESDENRQALAASLRDSIVQPGEVLIGSFGFLGPTKRLDAVALALANLKTDSRFKFLIVGDGPDPTPPFIEAGLRDCVKWLPYVPNADYDAWIQACDVVINLRYPSMGECSGTLTRAMGFAKPCIVTDYATFAEYPDGTVWKIPYGNAEVPSLIEAISALANSSAHRAKLGNAAQAHVHSVQAPARVAKQLAAILRGHALRRSHEQISNVRATGEAASQMRYLLDQRLQALLPSHLRDAPPQNRQPLPPKSLSLTEDELIWAFRVLLGRDPDPRTEFPAHLAKSATLAELREKILASDEFQRLRSPRRP